MANKSKIDKYLPADSIRFKAFAHHIATHLKAINDDGSPNISALLEKLSGVDEIIDISDQTLRKWFAGVDKPSDKKIRAVESLCPRAGDWLLHDLESNPLSRLFCAIDLWGSRITSNCRAMVINDGQISVGTTIKAISKRWAPTQIHSRGSVIQDTIIPQLYTHVPRQVSSTVYVSSNPLTLLDFMVRAPIYLEEMNEENFYTWAFDLAALTLAVCSYIESLSLLDQYNSGRTCDYARLIYRIFFIKTERWPTQEEIAIQLTSYSEIENPKLVSHLLFKARTLLEKTFLSIGTHLSFIEEIFEKISDKNIKWQEFSEHESHVNEIELNRKRKPTARATEEKYTYCFSNENHNCRVTFQLDGSTNESLLPPRPDLDFNYVGEFKWGYRGTGPRFLTKSLLAHHFGHGEFKSWEIERLLNTIEMFSCNPNFGPLFLSSDIIEACLSNNTDL